ncbi:MAG TPA: hypothetical protein VIJ25_20435 [Methylococcales bacterium]
MPKRKLEQEQLRLSRIGLAKKEDEEKRYEIISKTLPPLKPGEFYVFDGGMPYERWTPKDGWEIVIDEETDIRNELVLQHIEATQKKIIRSKNPPPRPEKIEGKRAKNWKPVWKWAKLHPQFSIKEIAALLKLNYTLVKSRLEEIDKEMGALYSPPSKSNM